MQSHNGPIDRVRGQITGVEAQPKPRTSNRISRTMTDEQSIQIADRLGIDPGIVKSAHRIISSSERGLSQPDGEQEKTLLRFMQAMRSNDPRVQKALKKERDSLNDVRENGGTISEDQGIERDKIKLPEDHMYNRAIGVFQRLYEEQISLTSGKRSTLQATGLEKGALRTTCLMALHSAIHNVDIDALAEADSFRKFLSVQLVRRSIDHLREEGSIRKDGSTRFTSLSVDDENDEGFSLTSVLEALGTDVPISQIDDGSELNILLNRLRASKGQDGSFQISLEEMKKRAKGASREHLAERDIQVLMLRAGCETFMSDEVKEFYTDWAKETGRTSMTLNEIGDTLGLSESAVCLIVNRVTDRLASISRELDLSEKFGMPVSLS